MLEEQFIFFEVGEEEEFTGEHEKWGLEFGVGVPVEVFIDEISDFLFVVYVVGKAVVCHVAD